MITKRNLTIKSATYKSYVLKILNLSFSHCKPPKSWTLQVPKAGIARNHYEDYTTFKPKHKQIRKKESKSKDVNGESSH